MQRLDQRIAMITGGASGIGKATAHRFASEGALILLTDIQDAAGEAVAAAIRAGGGQCDYLHFDVADEQAWGDAMTWAEQVHGGLDILVNNAGIGDLLTIEDTPLEQYERTIAVTQTSVFLGLRAAAPLLRRSNHGAVINVSSIFGASGGFGGSPAYHAAKGAVRILTKSTALHWAAEGIRVNSIHPGFIDTPILDPARGTPAEEAMLQMTPMGRLGRPEEIAAAIAFMASDDASFMTGAELYIDGGFMAR